MSVKDLVKRRHGTDVPVRRTSEADLFPLQREMNRLFDDFFHGFGLMPFWEGEEDLARSFTPSVNLSETDKEIKVSAELPGMEEEDISVELNGDTLTIRGEKKEEHEEKGKHSYCLERSYGSFCRVVPLPVTVDTEKVGAKFKKGVLSVTLPKLEGERAKGKAIEVTAG